MRSEKVRSVCWYGMILALCLILSFVESQIPAFFAVPGIKLGLTNVVVLLALYQRGWKSALCVNGLRILLSSMLFGNAFALLYSVAGGLLSGFVMIVLKQTQRFNIVSVSAAGGTAHNVGQILMAMVVLGTGHLLWYLAVLWFSGLLSGGLIGVLGGELVKRMTAIMKSREVSL